MKNLVLHPITQSQLQQFLTTPTHALLLLAPQGSGRGTVSQFLAAQLLNVDRERLGNYSFFSHIKPENKTISIETVRELIGHMHLKTIGKGIIRRVAIIEEANRLSTEGQSALLKLLEEPPADTVLIMTACGNTTLLSTVYSRMRLIQLQSPDFQSLSDYFASQGYSSEEIQRTYLISNGRPGLMSALLAHKQDHPLIMAIERAKQLLRATSFERLKQIDGISKQKDDLPIMLDALTCVAHAALIQAAKKQEQSAVAHWHRVSQHLLEATQALPSNPQLKLFLTNLFLAI